MRRTTLLAAIILLVFGAAAACGGGGGGQPAGSIKVNMTEFKFAPSAISAPAGKVTFYLVNSGSVAHDLVVIGPDGKKVAGSELVQAGNTSVLTVDNLTAGGYRIICDQPGHEDSGMKGTLTVT
ncbi:MAG TPA: cupredoxin domain-containing protein [Candidatus Dormibacteraeota bacterium]|nr:cupredoxin domain-containing protein [Candidatus Dormibacteraeota bacterium]